MEELKLILETLENLGNAGYNLFIVWGAKDIFKFSLAAGITYIALKSVIRKKRRNK